MPKVELARVSGDYGFDVTDENGHVIKMDTNPNNGGQNYGARPMQLLLVGLAGCSAIDVIGILKKQRQEVRDYKMVVNGDREAGVEPSLWKNINIEFHLYGDINRDKAVKAVELSVGKYCSVAATLEQAGAEIKWELFIHD
ncbi:MAG: OsmC family protein [Mucilaginibacter sp.]